MSEYEHFTVEGTTYGPYPALPVAPFTGYDEIAVTRQVAEQIAHDLNVLDAGCGLTAGWDGPTLTFTWTQSYDGEGGSKTVAPGADQLYRVGGLWPWNRATAAQIATAALAERGISSRVDRERVNSWLVVGEDEVTGSHAVLCLHRGDDERTMVERELDLLQDRWHAATVNPDGTEPRLALRPASRLGDCVEAIAAWIADGRPVRRERTDS
ncbi:hypothetical protein AB0D00_26720 [Streptomyces sp. NPDC048213]|uniref:hypothetical protein n=1 Tax=Streptomyces sp. NPDC048213 TaxID=3160984 RepID=UPI0034060F30